MQAKIKSENELCEMCVMNRCDKSCLIQMAVVPLLRHQGEMDSCGSDASGNSRPQEASLTPKLDL